ncbi:hypothetical protein [Oleisolibacter albus]|uniref:hypothetical protein n=1 Tax=Oleisolibacter albus TaxID=2171757 RepID=UPI0012D82C11|nr:hypothetical protein [Oleisolibacter albus]
MVRSVSRPLVRLLLAGAAFTLAGQAAAQSSSNTGAAGTVQQPSAPAGGGLILPGQVQTGPAGSPAAGTIAPRPQQAPTAAPAPQQPAQAAPQQQPSAQPAAAPKAPGKPAAPKGAWQVGPQVFTDGSFKLCAAGVEFDNNLHLLLLQNPEKHTNMVLGVPGARMPPGRQLKVKLTVDGKNKITREQPAVVSQPEAITIGLGNDAELLKALSNGSALIVEVPGDTASFQLKGTTKALSDLSTCVDQAKAGTLKLPPSPIPVIDEDLAKMLVKAGLQDARAIPVDKLPPQQRPGDYAWQLGDKVLGSVRGFPVGEEAGDFAAVTQKYMDQLKASCEGTFTPTLGQIETVPAYQVRNVSAQCEAKEGKIYVSMVLQFIPIPKQPGQDKEVRLLTVFTHETVEAEKAKADSASQGILKVLKEKGKQPLAQPGQAQDGKAPAKPAGK